MYAHFADGYEHEPFTVLDELMPLHIHFKLFENDRNGEYSVDYKGFLQYLHEKGYDDMWLRNMKEPLDNSRSAHSGKRRSHSTPEIHPACLEEIQG